VVPVEEDLCGVGEEAEELLEVHREVEAGWEDEVEEGEALAVQVSAVRAEEHQGVVALVRAVEADSAAVVVDSAAVGGVKVRLQMGYQWRSGQCIGVCWGLLSIHNWMGPMSLMYEVT